MRLVTTLTSRKKKKIILILCNLIVGWGEGVIKEGVGILHQIYIFREGV